MAPQAEDIWDELTRIERSGPFQRSTRMRQLLRYLIQQGLSAPDERIAAYQIGREVFRRPATFDPNEDPVVRVELVRLRKLLRRYYAENPKQRVLISVPKGQYNPSFETVTNEAAQVDADTSRDASATLGRDSIGIWIPTLSSAAPAEGHQSLLLALSCELFNNLSNVPELRVVHGTNDASAGEADQLATALNGFDCDYALLGNAMTELVPAKLYLQLFNTRTRQAIWSQMFTLDPAAQDATEVIQKIAGTVVRTVGTPAGTLFLNRLIESQDISSPNWDAVDCAMFWHHYRLISRAPRQHRLLRDRVHEILDRNPGWILGYAIKANLWLDSWQFRMDPTVSREKAFERARFFAQKAISMEPNSAIARHSTAIIEYFDGNVAAFEAAANAYLPLCPANTDILHHTGVLLFWGGNTSRGLELITEAGLRYHSAAGYRQFYLTKAYLEDELEEMHQLLSSTEYAPDWYMIPLLRALCDYRRGDRERASETMTLVFSRTAQLSGSIIEEIDKWFRLPKLRDRMIRDFQQLGAIQ